METVTVYSKAKNSITIHHNGETLKINGSGGVKLIGAHGITENVDKEFFEKWLSENSNHWAVKNGLILCTYKPQESNPIAEKSSVETESNDTFSSSMELVNKSKPTKSSQAAKK